MITATQQRPERARTRRHIGPAGIALSFALEISDSPDALMRVIATLHRRRCRLTAVEFRTGDRHYPGHLLLEVEAPASHAHCVMAWLRNLADVLSIEQEPRVGRIAAGTSSA